MSKYNSILVSEYNLENHIRTIDNSIIEEVDLSLQKEFIKQFDLQFSSDSKDVELEIHKMEHIHRYIELCKFVCISELKKIMNDEDPSDSHEFMILSN